jgi:putative transposase
MHQALQYKTPDEVYASASGGGALIVDKFPRPLVEGPVALRCTGSSTGKETGSQAKTGAAPSSCESNRVQLKLSEKLS